MELVKSNYLDGLLPGKTSLPPTPRACLNRLRGDALDVANALALPTTRDEEWRFTDLAPLYKSSF
jgi:Fe-S cluster assembly protein SufD